MEKQAFNKKINILKRRLWSIHFSNLRILEDERRLLSWFWREFLLVEGEGQMSHVSRRQTSPVGRVARRRALSVAISVGKPRRPPVHMAERRLLACPTPSRLDHMWLQRTSWPNAINYHRRACAFFTHKPVGKVFAQNCIRLFTVEALVEPFGRRTTLYK